MKRIDWDDVETKVASGKALDFRKLSPASSSAKPFTLVAIEAVSAEAESFDFSIAAGSQVSEPLARSKRNTLCE